MSASWSWFVIVLIVINLGGCIWLLWYTSRRRSKSLPTGETTGHTWDGDVTEYNKPLPRWWINLFYLTIVFTIAYLVLFPGFGNVRGTLNWSASAQHDADRAEADRLFAERYARFEQMPLAEIAADPEALAVGRNLYAKNCAACHASDGGGARGFPNLTDDAWQWGSTQEAILTSVAQGRVAVMPPLAAALGDDATITAVATYVQKLGGLPVDTGLAAVGKVQYEMVCAACHGIDGRGNEALGASNLTDADWLYGKDLASIREGILEGRHGMMPAMEPIMGPLRTRLVTAYTLSLSPGGQAAIAQARTAMAPAPAAPAAGAAQAP